MNLIPLWLFLHISVIFTAITVGYGITLVLRLAYMSGQVGILRGAGFAAGKVGPFVPPLFIAGGIFGLLTALATGTDLLAPWLVIAYVLFLLAMAIGIFETAPTGRKLGAILRTAPDGPLPAEVRELFDSQRAKALLVIDVLIPFVFIFDMVVKPFSS
ncbi:MAG TPA: hypothetical protein VF484_06855 [Candidatus Limnocylindrales bacterium]